MMLGRAPDAEALPCHMTPTLSFTVVGFSNIESPICSLSGWSLRRLFDRVAGPANPGVSLGMLA